MHLNLQTSIDATEFLVDTADSVAAPPQSPSDNLLSWLEDVVDSYCVHSHLKYSYVPASPSENFPASGNLAQTKLGATQMLRNPGYQATSTNKRREWIDNHSSFTIPQPLNGQFCGMFYTRSSQTSVCQRITCKAWKTGLLSPPPEQASHQ